MWTSQARERRSVSRCDQSVDDTRACGQQVGSVVTPAVHVIRPMLDIEALQTFEGTETTRTLNVGRDIADVSACT
ncbi:MAG: hypothetical protein QOF92_1436 [Pseudonocardiales bacterium]|nr:hypothetical protein [Pseudonocardiales bacterium]